MFQHLSEVMQERSRKGIEHTTASTPKISDESKTSFDILKRRTYFFLMEESCLSCDCASWDSFLVSMALWILCTVTILLSRLPFCADKRKEMICRFTADLNQFGFFTRPTLTQFGDLLPFDTLPLYALVHEPCYARE